MSIQPLLLCHCGERVLRKDVLQKGHFLRLFGPGFIYLKFRCSHCKRLGERFVPRDQWDESGLNESSAEVTPEERNRLASLGEISVEELISFHYELDRLDLQRLLADRD